jgi:hypothetical protein
VTRDQLEAVIWRESGRKLTAAQVDEILAAADDYAAQAASIAAERRAELGACAATRKRDRRAA